MSHFTVLAVTTESGEASLDALFEPYNENTQVAPYWEVAAATPADFWAYSTFVEEGLIQPGCSWEDLLKAYTEKYPEPDENLRVNDTGELEVETTYNPKSKWDWWQVGGGALRLKPGAEGAGTLGAPGVFGRDEEPDLWATDQARKGDLDIEGMRQAAAERANDRWDAYEKAVAGLNVEATETFGDIVDKHGVDEKDITPEERSTRLDAARKEYHAQPVIQATKEFVGFMGSWEDSYANHTRETYVEDARLGAVCGYAFLSDGTGWLEPGRMGWWGMSSDTPDTRREFHRKVAEVIDALPDDAVLTMVDCHI